MRARNRINHVDWCARMVILSVLACGAVVSAAPDEAKVKAWLSEAVIDKRLALEQVQAFTERRVPETPKVKTVEEWEAYAEQTRQRVLERVVLRGRAAEWAKAPTNVKWLGEMEGGEGYRIRKLRYEAVPGMWIAALLYEPTRLEGKVPVVMNVNGHDGKGKAAAYKQIRCINQAKRGMIALNVEWLGMGQHREEGNVHYRMNQIDLCGTSGLAPFYLSMKRGLDILLAHEHADPARVGVAGLSGGGWQTIFISALDTRVTCTNPVAGYSSFRTRARHFSDLGDSEQTPVDLATVTDYAPMTAMLAPRSALLTFNAADACCFKASHAMGPLVEAAYPIYKMYGKLDRLSVHVNVDPGSHNFDRDNRQALYRVLGEAFYPTDKTYDWREIESDGEVKDAAALNVELPEGNATFHTLASELMTELPRDAALPGVREGVDAWRAEVRRKVETLIAATREEVKAEEAGRVEEEGWTVRRWRLNVGEAWTVPATELVKGKALVTTIVIGDLGRAGTAGLTRSLVESGARVVAVDPFFFGESKIASHDFLFALLVSATGSRPVGIQASQLASIARWAKKMYPDQAVQIVADGPRTSLMALLVGVIESEAIARVELRGSMGSLKEVIEQNRAVNQAPELFCFGLLEAVDIKQLVAAAGAGRVRFAQASDRVKAEMKAVAEWFEGMGARVSLFGE